MSDDLEDLKPARPDVASDERKGYMPSLPWRWIGAAALFFGLSIGTCHIRDRKETEALRQTVLEAYGKQLASVAQRYQERVAKIRTDTTSAAAKSEAETYLDPRLDLDALGASPGLYLRIPASKATPEQLRGSMEVTPDAIARCLGLAPHQVGELLSKGSFLEKDWIEQAQQADSVLKLRVVAEELRQRSARDLPFVADALAAQWFMLVLERGKDRREAPVDVFLWDLDSNKLLLSTRAKASGALISARINVAGVPAGHYADGAQTGAASDCSLASQIRAVAGEAAPGFKHAPPTPSAPSPTGAAGSLDAPTVDGGH